MDYSILYEYQSVFPIVRNTVGPPSPQASVPPPGTQWGGGGSNTLLWVRGLGGHDSDVWIENLALCIYNILYGGGVLHSGPYGQILVKY